MEGLGTTNRSLAVLGIKYILLLLFWFLAAAFSALAAFLITSWKHLTMAVEIPFIPLVICLFFLIDESPSWLMEKGKLNRAIKIISKIARINGNPLPDSEIRLLLVEAGYDLSGKDGEANLPLKPNESRNKTEEISIQGQITMLTLFTERNLALIAISICFLWGVNAMGKSNFSALL